MTPMIVQCFSCRTEFELDPNKVPAAGVRARCSVCSAVITVPAPHKDTTQRDAPASHEPEQTHAAVTASPEPTTTHGVEHAQRPAPEPAAGSSPSTFTATPEPWRPATTPPVPPARAAVPEASEPELIAPALPVPEPPAPEPPAPEPPVKEAPYAGHLGQETSGTDVATTAPVGRDWGAPHPSEPRVTSPAEADSGQRRPINPFLTRDPALRAKRLARALVSDIVAYHPARHAEGLRDGTLKTLFRDEIKKSYEEYVDQVGRDFAGSTTHFQDALNDVLASGKKLF